MKTYVVQTTIDLTTFDRANIRRHIEDATRLELCENLSLHQPYDERIKITWEFFPVRHKAVCTATINL